MVNYESLLSRSPTYLYNITAALRRKEPVEHSDQSLDELLEACGFSAGPERHDVLFPLDPSHLCKQHRLLGLEPPDQALVVSRGRWRKHADGPRSGHEIVYDATDIRLWPSLSLTGLLTVLDELSSEVCKNHRSRSLQGRRERLRSQLLTIPFGLFTVMLRRDQTLPPVAQGRRRIALVQSI